MDPIAIAAMVLVGLAVLTQKKATTAPAAVPASAGYGTYVAPKNDEYAARYTPDQFYTATMQQWNEAAQASQARQEDLRTQLLYMGVPEWELPQDMTEMALYEKIEYMRALQAEQLERDQDFYGVVQQDAIYREAAEQSAADRARAIFATMQQATVAGNYSVPASAPTSQADCPAGYVFHPDSRMVGSPGTCVPEGELLDEFFV